MSKITIGSIIKSKNDSSLTTWIVTDINVGLSGKKCYTCKAKHDTKKSYGFDSIFRDFKKTEIELY
jgi:hypothetical protein